MPFCKLTLKGPKPPSASYPKALKTLGDHLRKVRLDRGLTQKQVAEELAVVEITITGWEKSNTKPSVRQIPKILRFLGYNPLRAPESLAERLKYHRTTLGLSQEKVAHILDLDESTLAGVERGSQKPNQMVLSKLMSFLND